MRLLELTLRSPDPARQHRFYREVLGLSEAQGFLQAGASRFRFLPGETGGAPYHFAFNVPPQAFDDARRWLRERVPLLCDSSGADRFPFEFWDAEASYFRDPDGNLAEFIARQERPGPDGSDFDPSCILEISEVGLPSDSPADLREMVASQLEAPSYRNLFREDFGALGDAQGLLILVRTGREWYPETGIPARALPLTLLFESGGRRARLQSLPYQLKLTNP